MIDTQLTTVNLMTIETVDCTLALFLWAELAEAHSYIVHKVFVVVYAIRPEIRKDLGLNKLVSDFLALRKKGAVGSQKKQGKRTSWTVGLTIDQNAELAHLSTATKEIAQLVLRGGPGNVADKDRWSAGSTAAATTSSVATAVAWTRKCDYIHFMTNCHWLVQSEAKIANFWGF